MTKVKLILLLCFFAQLKLSAQVKIGNNPSTINSASLLELETTNKGFVLPRVALTSLNSSNPLPSNPLQGTIVFNTNTSVGSGIGLYYWNGSAWVAVTSGSGGGNAWSLTGNSGTNSLTNFVGTTDDHALVFRTNNIKAGFIGSQNDGQGQTSLGINAITGNQNSTAIGTGAVASQNSTTALGQNANANQQNAMAIGVNSNGSGNASVAVGFQSQSGSQSGIAIGNNTRAVNSTDNIAIGTNANATQQNGISIGTNSSANAKPNSVALGNIANAAGRSSIAVGDSAIASGARSLAIGAGAIAAGTNSIAMGDSSVASSRNATAYGAGSHATALDATAFGNLSTASGLNSVVVGTRATAAGRNSISIGDNASVASTGSNSVVLGNNSNTADSNVVVIGNNITGAGQANSLILGANNVNVGIGTTTPDTAVKLDVEGAFKFGTGTQGTILKGIIKTNVTIIVPNINNQNTVFVTATVTGANPNATVFVNPRTQLPPGYAIAYSFISAADTLTLALLDNTGSGAPPAPVTFDVTVVQ